MSWFEIILECLWLFSTIFEVKNETLIMRKNGIWALKLGIGSFFVCFKKECNTFD
jgi:hypothetical protein